MALHQLQKNSLIGILGFGAMGKSAVHYLHTQGYRVQVMDCRILTEKEQQFLRERNSKWYDQTTQKDLFFNSSDIIIPSPGVNINKYNYATFFNKFISELDFFYYHCNKPIIAITGSVGKTSVTSILGQIFTELSIPVAIGGNIGIPTFDLLTQRDAVDYTLLEVSSFQLQHCRHFAPHLAMWTNFYPNHLDYHETENEYFAAKAMLLQCQKNNSLSLVPFSLREKLPPPSAHHIRSYFTTEPIDHIQLNMLHHNERLYYIENDCILCYADSTYRLIMRLTPELYNLSFTENILIIASACDLMKFDTSVMQSVAKKQCLPAHRMEYVGTINNVMFYNDSKATTTASTLAALERLKNKSVHLFLGGLSKGVNRTPFIAQLKNKVQHVYCFGKEAMHLYDMCIQNDISALHFATLDDAFAACIQVIRPHDYVLLSPAGSSFDLYTNYEERGEHFKHLFLYYEQRLHI